MQLQLLSLALAALIQEETLGSEPCLVLCHLPPPLHQWNDFLEERCDKEHSLFLDSDVSAIRTLYPPDRVGHLSFFELSERQGMIEFYETYNSTPAEEKALNAKYHGFVDAAIQHFFLDGHDWQRIKAGEHHLPQEEVIALRAATCSVEEAMAKKLSRETACGIAVSLRELKELQVRGLQADWPARRDAAEAACRARRWPGYPSAALREALQALEAREEFQARREQAYAFLASVGGERGDLLLPAPREGCGSDQDCLMSRFVPAENYEVPAAMRHRFPRVVLKGCPHSVIVSKPVQEVARTLATPDAEVFIYGFSFETLRQVYADSTKVFGVPLSGPGATDGTDGHYDYSSLRLGAGSAVRKAGIEPSL